MAGSGAKRAVSFRFDRRIAAHLKRRSTEIGEPQAALAERYIEEGLRMDEHPLITFRDGPTGRRAGLIGGPDVWEVALWIDDLAGETHPAAVVVAESGLSRAQVDAALRYRAAYPDEIAARIELHRSETAAGAGETAPDTP